jgi:DNA-binding Lrp family transcriptional regulator
MVKPKNRTSSYASWQQIVPSKFQYFEGFKELDQLDLNIIFAMAESPSSPRNVRKISQELGLPQQTVNYRVQRFDKEGLVRFRAVINERLLGLTNYMVMVTVRPGLVYVKSKPSEHETLDAETFLTCYPVWRLVEEVHGGSVHGFCVVYSIPSEKENDLKSFLEELKNIGCISRIDEFCKVTPSHYNIPRQDLLQLIRSAITRGEPISFNWENWVGLFDKGRETILIEDTPRNRPLLNYEDLLVLFHLEGNLREKFVDIAKKVGEPSGKIAKRYKEILRDQLITRCRVEIYPVDPATASLHLTMKISFSNGSALRRFVANLDEIPYSAICQKPIGKDVLFLHVIIPSYEYVDFHNTFEALNRRLGIIRNVDLYASTYYSKFDNIALYDAFSKEGNTWAFSKDTIVQALHRLIDYTGFRFEKP